MPSYEAVGEKVAQIEAEMKRIGMWQNEPLKPEQLQFRAAFAGDTMAFSQWLQFIFLFRVKDIIANHGKFPSSSQVHAQAYREWEMYGGAQNVDELLEMLKQFDAMFTG